MYLNINDYISFFNRITSKYLNNITPINNYNYNKYYALYEQNSILSDAVDRVISACTLNSWNITSTISTHNKKNEKYEWEVYNFLKNKNIDALFSDYILFTLLTGNAYAIVNEDNDIIIKDNREVKVYYDTTNNKVIRYALLVDGIEEIKKIPKIKKFSDKKSQSICVPRIESIYDACVLHNICIEVNQQMIGSGNIGTAFAVINQMMANDLNSIQQNDPKKRRKIEILVESIADKFKFIKNNQIKGNVSSNNIGAIVGLEKFIELGKSNNDMQLMQLIEYLERKIYDRIGIKYTSQDATYANAETLKYENYENVAKSRLEEFEDFMNYFYLPHFKLDADNKIKFVFNKPISPNTLAIKKEKLNEIVTISNLINSATTTLELINEYRDEYNMTELTVNEQVQDTTTNNISNFIEEKKNEKFFTRSIENFNALNLFDLAIESESYESDKYDEKTKTKKKIGLKPNFERALKKQIEDYIKKIENEENIEKIIKNIEKDVKNLETYYSYPSLKKDLFKFVDIVIKNEETIKKIKELQTKEYPSYLEELIDERINMLLKSEDNRLDITLYNNIKRILEKQETLNISDLQNNLLKITETRAENIAQTEINYTIEGTRNAIYNENKYTKKRLINVNDSRVSSYCISADALDIVDINYKYISQWGKKEFPPLHNRCRSSCEYYK